MSLHLGLLGAATPARLPNNTWIVKSTFNTAAPPFPLGEVFDCAKHVPIWKQEETGEPGENVYKYVWIAENNQVLY